MIWITADTHFNHKNIIKYCNRPFKNVQEMNRVIINNWNTVVKNIDTVFIVGDYYLGKFVGMVETTQKLKGKKILIMGNHDRFTRTQYLRAGFIEVYKSQYKYDKLRMIHNPAEAPKDIPLLNIGVDVWNFYPIPLPVNTNKIILVGHIHDEWLVNVK